MITLPESFFFSQVNMVKKLGYPKTVNHFYISLSGSEIVWMSQKVRKTGEWDEVIAPSFHRLLPRYQAL